MTSINQTLQPGIKKRIEITVSRGVRRLRRGVDDRAIPTPPSNSCLAFIWPYNGAFLVTTRAETRKVFTPGRGTVACYYTFPTEEAAIMFALATN